jgi:hypothetical protein
MQKMVFLTVLAILFVGPSAFAQDPGMPDSAIFGNLDGSPIYTPYPFAPVPVWIKNDEDLTFLNICFGADTNYARVSGEQLFPPLTAWDYLWDTLYVYLPDYPQYAFESIWGVCDDGGGPNPPLNTDSLWQQIMVFRVLANGDTSQIGDTTCLVAIWPGISSVQAGCIIFGPPQSVGDQRLPRAYEVLRIYPNPFNALATISYWLPEESDVTIEIYEISGRKVETIQEGAQAAGDHLVQWDSGDRNSGIYFCRLKAGRLSQTQRMVLLK